MKTAIKLCEYDDILNPRYIYSLLCLAALKNRFFGICSKAFVKVRCTCLQPLHIVCLTMAVHVSPAGDASHPVRGRPRRHPDSRRADLHQERALGPGHPTRAVPEVPGGGPLLQGLRHLRQVTNSGPSMHSPLGAVLTSLCYGYCRAIQESPAHMCKSCRHLMLEHELESHKWAHCPLCHSPLILPSSITAAR
jgi:WD repeat-containing protein 35